MKMNYNKYTEAELDKGDFLRLELREAKAERVKHTEDMADLKDRLQLAAELVATNISSFELKSKEDHSSVRFFEGIAAGLRIAEVYMRVASKNITKD